MPYLRGGTPKHAGTSRSYKEAASRPQHFNVFSYLGDIRVCAQEPEVAGSDLFMICLQDSTENR